MSEEAPPRELVIDAKPAPGDSSDGGGTAMAPFLLPVGVAAFLAKFVSPTVAVIAFVGIVIILLARRKPNHGRSVLRVHDGVLEIARERGGPPPVTVPVADVLDVTLDKETRQGGRGGMATERVWIALERRAPADPIFVPEERIAALEGQEWQGKVRVFLRKHGWLPVDERR